LDARECRRRLTELLDLGLVTAFFSKILAGRFERRYIFADMVKMKLLSTKWVAAVTGTLLLMAAAGHAQSTANPIISITSKPTGVSVVLSGDMTVAGITPTTFSQKLSGLYRITAHLEGYENYHSSVLLSGREATTIDIKMSPRTRFKAAMRSLIIPGWGQIYSGSKTKGVLLTMGTVAAGVTAGLLQSRHANDRSDFNDFRDKFDATRSVEEREGMLDQLYQIQKKAYDAERNRNIGLGVLAGVWIYNLLDALVFFPDYNINISGATLSFQPDIRDKGIKFVGTVKF
jgi:hypothetical protein